MLIGTKPLRKGLPNGQVEIDYFTPFHNIVKGSKFFNLLQEFNKLGVRGETL